MTRRAKPIAERKPFPEQLAAIFQDASNNIQQWRVTNYALLLYGTLFLIRKEAPFGASCGARGILLALVAVIATASPALLLKLEKGVSFFRDRIGDLYEHKEGFFTDEDRKRFNLRKKERWSDPHVFIILGAVSLVSGVVVSILIWMHP